MTSTPPTLTAAELMVLRDPNRAQGREALKLTFMELLARQALTMRREERTGFMGRSQTTEYLDPAPDARQRTPGRPHARAALDVAMAAAGSGRGATMEQLIKQAQQAFGADLAKFQTEHVRLDLIRSGLLEERTERVLLIFPVRRYRHTPAGAAALQRLDEQVQEARSVPALLDSSPIEAAALALSLGSAILLVDELRPHYSRLSQAMRDPGGSDASFNPVFFASDTSDPERETSAAGLEALDAGGRSFDADSFGALDTSLDSFDSSFDSATSSGDSSGGDSSGGDGGGGDGGGGGGGE